MSKKKKRGNKMNFLQNLNRHPQQKQVDEPIKEYSKIQLDDCWRKIKKLFVPVAPEITSLVFSPYSQVKINCYINLIGDFEITGLGKVENGIITDLKLIEQVVKPALVDCTADHIVDFINEVGADEIGKWTLDWHSHVNMGVSPSETDKTNWATMFEAREYKQFPVMIINKKGNVYCHCYMGDDDSESIDVKYQPVTMTTEEVRAIYDDCAKEVTNKCTREQYKTNNYYNGGYNPIGYNYSQQRSVWDDYEDDYEPVSNNSKIVVPKGYDYQNITKKSNTVEENKDQCCFCGCELTSIADKNVGICKECFDKYNCETEPDEEVNTKCPSCGCEMDEDEIRNGLCDDCAEAFTRELITKE